VALGIADDRTAIPVVAELVQDTTADDYARAASCLSLGLLRSTDHAPLLLTGLLDTKWNAETRGYALLGLALMGDTTRMAELIKIGQRGSRREIKRQLPLALGVLGDKDNVRALSGFFAKNWKQADSVAVSNAAYAFAWNRDQSSLARLVKLANNNANASVRGMATIALGYLAARDRVSPLTRCYENMSFRSRFSGWSVLYTISRIL
jgi:HEAT repeat protein